MALAPAATSAPAPAPDADADAAPASGNNEGLLGSITKATNSIGSFFSGNKTDTPQRRNSSGGSKGGPGKSRCKRGSRRNKAGDCVRVVGYTAKKRCPKGTRRSKVTGACEQLKGMVKKVAK